jgi:2-keto-4-pentenoate hydratase/2-oxohepta-3-ene-1,7-dioic acid hydratase in catechol pathway
MGTVFSLMTLDEATPTPAIEVGGQVWRLAEVADAAMREAMPRGLIDLLQDWDRWFDALSTLAERVADKAAPVGQETELRSLTPVRYPNKVMLTGTNYYDHLRAVGRANFSKQDNDPAFFMKPPTTALVGHGSQLRIPDGVQQFDWEVELTAVIGRRATRVSESQALAHVAAYAVGLDMSARDLQRNPRHFAKMDLCLGKAFDGSCPVGPKIVPAAFVADPQDLTLQLWVNGTLEQNSSTRHMIWSTAEQLAAITRHITLEPGDLLLTGTPAGTGIEQGRYLHPGDHIDAEIQGLGRLSVDVAP